MNFKHLIHSILLMCTILFMFSCSENTVTEDQDPKKVDEIAGLYEAIVFTEPGTHDGGVDILDNGGSLTATLLNDYRVEGHLVIPDSIDSNFPPTDTSFEGNFSIDVDTVRFENTGTFLDSDPWMFIITDEHLSTPEWTGRWALTEIVLFRNIR